jgi:hypothetical protein
MCGQEGNGARRFDRRRSSQRKRRDSSTQDGPDPALTGRLVVNPAALAPRHERAVRRYAGSRSKVTPAIRAQIIADRANVKSLRDIAARFNLSHQGIADVIREDARNEHLIASNHPLRDDVITQLGTTARQRRRSVQQV